MEANLKARKIFNRQQDPKYMPHLSLMYGNFSPIIFSPIIKEEIIDSMGREFDISFEVGSISLFPTNGEPLDFCKVKEFTLN
jgi:hypothetical protein